MRWIEALATLEKEAQGYVLLTVLGIRGSSPRDTGTKMVVSVDKIFDTIGGGALEFESIEIARKLLTPSPEGEGWGEGSTKSFSQVLSPHPTPLPKERGLKIQYTHTFNLGRDLKQCCGGVVEVFFEVFPAINFNINIFGAGHIGQALIKIFSELDCQVKLFDSRPELLSKTSTDHIQVIQMNEPEIAVESCNADSYYLVMTHDHALDQQLCEAILSRADSSYCGLIGSRTKGLKFRQRLMKKGFSQQELEQLTCPVGLDGLKTKKPMEIALSIVAELLQIKQKYEESTVSTDNSQIIRLEIDA